MLLTGGQETHTSLALYVFIRGLTLLVRCGNLPGAHPLKVSGRGCGCGQGTRKVFRSGWCWQLAAGLALVCAVQATQLAHATPAAHAATTLCAAAASCARVQRKLLAPTRMKYGDVALMCLSTAQIGYSWMVLPQVGGWV